MLGWCLQDPHQFQPQPFWCILGYMFFWSEELESLLKLETSFESPKLVFGFQSHCPKKAKCFESSFEGAFRAFSSHPSKVCQMDLLCISPNGMLIQQEPARRVIFFMGFVGFCLMLRISGKRLEGILRSLVKQYIEQYHPRPLDHGILWSVSGRTALRLFFVSNLQSFKVESKSRKDCGFSGISPS